MIDGVAGQGGSPHPRQLPFAKKNDFKCRYCMLGQMVLAHHASNRLAPDLWG